VPIVEPTSVEQAARVMAQAFAWSESLGTPVIVRITRALALATGLADEPWELPPPHKPFLRKRNRWIVLPYLVVQRHEQIHARVASFQGGLDASPYDARLGDGPLGVIAVGYAYTKLLEALGDDGEKYALWGSCSSWPLPVNSLAEWLGGRQRVLVLEEGGPFVEQQVRSLAQSEAVQVQVLGRDTHTVPRQGELSERDIAAALAELDPTFEVGERPEESRVMPSTVQLCPDCPYRPVFEALIGAMEKHGGRERFIVVGETGCMVRANLPPMELFDVKYNLGSGLGIGMGLAQADTRHHVVALVGDSSFFHSDIPAMPHVAQHRPPMTVIALDNGTTALTGGQAHPGSAADERGQDREQVADLVDVIAGCGARPALYAPEDADLPQAIDQALASREFSIMVVRGACTLHLPKA
jgi:indolepyruvate ferredoxin oxidoreductase alpha subunit